MHTKKTTAGTDHADYDCPGLPPITVCGPELPGVKEVYRVLAKGGLDGKDDRYVEVATIHRFREHKLSGGVFSGPYTLKLGDDELGEANSFEGCLDLLSEHQRGLH